MPEDVGEGRGALHLLVEEAAVQGDAQEVEKGCEKKVNTRLCEITQPHTGLFAYSDTHGKRDKCHYNQMSHYPMIFSILLPFFRSQNSL